MKEVWIYWKEEKSRLTVNERGLDLPVGEKKQASGK